MKKVPSLKSQVTRKEARTRLLKPTHLLSLVTCLLSLALFSFPLHAVEIEPMRLEHSLGTGKTYSGSFKLKNPSTFAVDIFVSTGGYRYLFSESMIPPKYGTPPLPSCQNWLRFEKTKFSLEPGESAEAKFLIKVPADAKAEQLCAVIFEEKTTLKEQGPQEKIGNVQIQLIPRFSIPVYISIKENEKISAQIRGITVFPETQKGGVMINLTLENTGNVHIRPLGTLVIFNQNGEVIKTLPIGKSLPIFPGYKDVIPVICRKLPAGKYSAVATIEVAKNNIIQKKTAFTVENSGEVE